MSKSTKPPRAVTQLKRPVPSQWGVAACAEAQPDGIPCAEVGSHCEKCGRAMSEHPRERK